MRKQIPIIISLMFLAGCSGNKPELGVNNGVLAPCPKTANCVNSQTTDEKHHIQPLRFTGTQQKAKIRLLQIITSDKRSKILIEQDTYIRLEFTSALFGFIDDVEFYFPEQKGNGTIIHVRSASRVGYSDLGVNRKRIEQIRNKFSADYKK